MNFNITTDTITYVTVSDFLDNCHKFTGQEVEKDYCLNNKNLNSYINSIHGWIDSMGTFISVWTNGEICSGNTRYEAISRSLALGRISPTTKFRIIIKPIPANIVDQQLSTIYANIGNSNNMSAVMMNSDSPQSVCGYTPIHTLICNFAPIISKAKKETITKNLVALIDKVGLENLEGCLGNDIYRAKSLPLTKREDWFNQTISFDLRTEESRSIIRKLLIPGLTIIQDVYSDKDVRKVIGAVTNIQYMILALGFKGLLDTNHKKSRDKLTATNLKKWFTDPSNSFRFEEIFKATFLNKPHIAEAAFVADVLKGKTIDN